MPQRNGKPIHRTKTFDGHYIIYRKLPRGLSRKVAGSRLPGFLHDTLQSAEREACRLSELFPESTFVISHIVATVKPRDRGLKPDGRDAASDSIGEADESPGAQSAIATNSSIPKAPVERVGG